MQEPDSDCRGVARSSGLDVGKGLGAFENVLEGFEEAVAGYFCGEAACAGEGFDNAGLCLDWGG